jgi:hypothetical protein
MWTNRKEYLEMIAGPAGGSLGAISANSYSSLLPVTFSEWTELTEEVSSLVLRSEAYCMTTGLCRGR